jgi:hypothetical protein
MFPFLQCSRSHTEVHSLSEEGDEAIGLVSLLMSCSCGEHLCTLAAVVCGGRVPEDHQLLCRFGPMFNMKRKAECLARNLNPCV